jgi:hypothetical protein
MGTSARAKLFAIFVAWETWGLSCGGDDDVKWECLLSDGKSGCACYEAPLSWVGPSGNGPACNPEPYLCCYLNGPRDQQPGCVCTPPNATPDSCDPADLEQLGRKLVAQCPPP